MKWRTTRLALDFLLVGMLVFEMFYMFTGNFLHEVVGVVFFVTLAVHMVFGRKWVTGIRSRAISAGGSGVPMKQKVKAAICVALVAMFALLLVSSVLISNILTSATGWMLSDDAYSLVAFAHMVCAYAVCVFAIGHIGMHWISLFKALRIPYDPSRRKAINAGVMTLASLGAVAVGLAATKEVATWTGFAEMLSESRENNRTVAESTAEQSNAGSTSSNDRKRSQNTTERSSRNNAQSDSSGSLQNENPSTSQRNSSNDQSNNESSGNSTNDSSSSESSSKDSSSKNPFESVSSNNSSSNGSANTSTAICLLCHKHCPLSAPKCNKPYAAGLI